MRTGKIFLAGLVLMVLALGAWAGWGRYGYLVRDDPSARLQSEALAGPGERAIALAQMTDFGWERVVFFGPYTTQAQAAKALGFEWPGLDETGIRLSDSYSLIVFAEAGRVTRWWKLRRCAPDVDKSFASVPVSRADATLVLRNGADCSILRGPAATR